jgi:hypothetical protein
MDTSDTNKDDLGPLLNSTADDLAAVASSLTVMGQEDLDAMFGHPAAAVAYASFLAVGAQRMQALSDMTRAEARRVSRRRRRR